MPGEAARRDLSADGQHPPVAVEEDEVEGEAHTEGVDAAAARDQQAGARRLAPQAGEAEQARPEVDCDLHLAAEHGASWQGPEAAGELAGSAPHSLPMAAVPRLSPTLRQ